MAVLDSRCDPWDRANIRTMTSSVCFFLFFFQKYGTCNLSKRTPTRVQQRKRSEESESETANVCARMHLEGENTSEDELKKVHYSRSFCYIQINIVREYYPRLHVVDYRLHIFSSSTSFFFFYCKHEKCIDKCTR